MATGTTAVRSPTDDIGNHTIVLRQLKEVAEVGQRLRGDPLDSFVKVRELVTAGIARFTNNQIQPAGSTAGSGGTVITALSVQGNGSSGTPIELAGDSASPGNTMLYGTNGSGVKGWYAQPAGGSSTLAGLSDVSISAPANGQVLTYNSSTTKWQNQAGGGGSGALTKIAEQILSSTTATVTFSSIPNTYRNLILKVTVAATVNTAPGFCLQFNGDTGANYVAAIGYVQASGAVGSGGSPGPNSIQFSSPLPTNATANTAGSMTIVIYDYARAVWDKNVTGQFMRFDTSSQFFQGFMGGMWSSNAAINSIACFLSGGGSFVSGSVFSLYGES